jgi:hypothetical protein
MKQKSWNPANFRVKVGDLPSTNNAGNAAKAGNAGNAANAVKLNSLIKQPGTAKLVIPAVKPR